MSFDKVTLAHELADIENRILFADRLIQFTAPAMTNTTSLRTVCVGVAKTESVANRDLHEMAISTRDRLSKRRQAIEADMKWSAGAGATQ